MLGLRRSNPYKHPRSGNDCYDTIMFGRVTHTLDAAAGVLSVYLTTILYINLQLPFDRKREYMLFHYWVLFIGILATTNLYY